MININPIYKFLSWLSFFLFICLIGISDIFALENGGAIRFYDNNGSSLTYKTTDYIQQTDESSATFTTTANSYGGGVMLQLPTPLIQNHIYTLFVNVAAANMGGFTKPSTKNCIGVGNGYTDTINSYVNCSITPKYTQESGVTADKRNGLYFTFIANTNASYVLIAYTSDNTCYNCYQYSYGYNISDGGDTSGLSQTQVNNIINQQTTTIQNDIYNMQQAVAGSIDDLNDTIEDTFNTKIPCYNLFNSSTGQQGWIDSNGLVQPASTNFASDYIYLGQNTNFTISANETLSNIGIAYYDNSKNIISREDNRSKKSITKNTNNNYYVRFWVEKSGTSMSSSVVNSLEVQLTKDSSVKPYCAFGSQINSNKLDEQTNAINGLNDTLNDTSSADLSSLNNSAGWLPAGPIDSIINLPLNFLNSILSALSGTCSPLNITIPFLNTNASIPCLSTIFSQITGLTTFWNWVGRIASIYILYRYLISLWEYYDRLTTMQVNFRDDFGGGV